MSSIAKLWRKLRDKAYRIFTKRMYSFDGSIL